MGRGILNIDSDNIDNNAIPFPNKKYQVIYADPPWEVKRGPDWGSSGPSKPLPYPTW